MLGSMWSKRRLGQGTWHEGPGGHEASCAAWDHLNQHLRKKKGAQYHQYSVSAMTERCHGQFWAGKLWGTPGSVQDINGPSFLFQAVSLKGVH